MTIQRWAANYEQECVHDNSGPYVLHADHLAALAAVEAERDAARERCAWLEECNASYKGTMDDGDKLVEELTAERDALKARVEPLEAGVRKIASCESRYPGDVVSIAKSLVETP